MKYLIVLALVVAGCNAQSATWVARTTVPIKIAVDNFSAICVLSNLNVSETTVFQWMNGTKISPKANRYVIAIGSLSNVDLQSVMNSNLTSNMTWEILSSFNSTETSQMFAQITIYSVLKDEVGGILCANRTELQVDAYAYVAMGAGMKASKNVIQGDEYCLTCEAYGSPIPETVSWYKNGLPLVTDSRVVLISSNKTMNTTLRFSPAEFVDDGDYTCYTWNSYGTSGNVTMMLRVKDRWAALWPFLGIVAEVIVLCAIILLYEKRQQSKLEAEEDDKDRSTLMNDGGANDKDEHGAVANGDDVRQRPIIKS